MFWWALKNLEFIKLSKVANMPPVRKKAGKKQKLTDWSAPYHDFLGPGTDLEKNKNFVPRSKLDLAAKIHDFHYTNKSIPTEEADRLFYENTHGTGALNI